MRRSIKNTLLKMLDKGKSIPEIDANSMPVPEFYLREQLEGFIKRAIPELYANLTLDGVLTDAEIRQNALYIRNKLALEPEEQG